MKKNKVIASVIAATVLTGIVGSYSFWGTTSVPKNSEISSPIIKSPEQIQLENKLVELKSTNSGAELKIRGDTTSGRITGSFAIKIADRLLSNAPFSQEIEQFILNDSSSGTGATESVAYEIAPELSIYAGLTVDECVSFYKNFFGSGSELESHTRLCQNAVLLVDFLGDSARTSLTEKEKSFITGRNSLYQQVISVRKGEPFECVDSADLICSFLLKGRTISGLKSLSTEELELAPTLSYVNMGPLGFFMDLTTLSLEQKVIFFVEYAALYKFFYTGDSTICGTLTTAPFVRICDDWTKNRESQKQFYRALLSEYLLSIYTRSYGKS